MRTQKRTLAIIVVLLTVLSVISIPAFAAATGTHTPVEGVTVEVSGATDNSMTDGAVTVTAQGSAGLFGFGASAKTATITITNDSGSKANVSCSVAKTDVNSFSASAGTLTETSFTMQMEAGDEVTLTLTTAKNSTENKVVLSDFKCIAVEDNATATVTFDSTKGSVSLAGSTVNSGDSVTATGGQLAAVATPASGCSFVAWVNVDTNEILSQVANTTLNVPQSVNVQAVFIKGTTDNAYFQVGNYLYDDLTTAVTKGSTVVLANNGVLPAGDYTIPAGVTLLVPYDDSYTLCTTKPVYDGTSGLLSAVANAWTKPTAYRTLTLADGANVVVNGAISISGKVCGKQGANGCPTGPLGFINMASGSNITINNGAFLYAWGYITGSGSVTVKSGGTVYENFQVKDWRGGTAASGMIDKSQRVFPVSQYYVQNVEVPMTLEAGAVEYGYMCLVASKTFGESTVPFIGGSGMFQNKGTIIKDYLEETDRLSIEIYGDLTMSSLNLEVSSYDMNSANYVLPIVNNLTVTVKSGTTTIGQDMCMLPGSEVFISEDAKVSLAQDVNFFVYDTDEWVGKLYVYSARDVSPLTYVGWKKDAPATRAALADAKIVVNGILDASLGYLYSTASGANITSDGGGQVIVGTLGTAEVTYQATQSGTTITFADVLITSGRLLNGDGITYVSTTADTTYTYCGDCLQWLCEENHGHATNVELGNSLNMYFAFWSDSINAEQLDQYKVTVVHTDADGNKISQELSYEKWYSTSVDGNQAYVVYYKGLAAKQMCDTVTVTLYNGSTAVYTWSNSIQNYVMRMLEKYSENEKLRTLLVDMLNYGAACQTNFGYDADNLANALLSDTQKAWATDDVTIEDNSTKNEYHNGSNLITTSNIQFAVAFNNSSNIAKIEYTFTNHWRDGDNGLAAGEAVTKIVTHDGSATFSITNLVVADARQAITITVYDSEGNLLGSWTDSIESYCARMIDSTSATDEQKAVCNAFMKFADSAEAYLEGGKIE